MKYLNSSLLLFWLLFTISCTAQKMVKKEEDAIKLELNKEKFIGKPLSILLAQISPEIKGAVGSPSGSAERPSYIIFYFQNTLDYRQAKKAKPAITSIRVYFTENFEWEIKGKTMANWMDWTKEDAKKYSYLVVREIKVTH